MKRLMLVGLILWLIFPVSVGAESDEVNWEIEFENLTGEYYSQMSEDGWTSIVRGMGHGIIGTVSGDNGSLGQEVNLTSEGSRFEREETGTIDDVDFSLEVIVEGTNGITVQEESSYLGNNFIWGAPPGEDFLLKAQGDGFIYWRLVAEKPDEVFDTIKVAEVINDLTISGGHGLLHASNTTDSIFSVAEFDGNAIFSPGETDLVGGYAEGQGSFNLQAGGDEHIKVKVLDSGLEQDVIPLPEMYFVYHDFLKTIGFSGIFEGPDGSLTGPLGENLVSFDFEGS